MSSDLVSYSPDDAEPGIYEGHIVVGNHLGIIALDDDDLVVCGWFGGDVNYEYGYVVRAFWYFFTIKDGLAKRVRWKRLTDDQQLRARTRMKINFGGIDSCIRKHKYRKKENYEIERALGPRTIGELITNLGASSEYSYGYLLFSDFNADILDTEISTISFDALVYRTENTGWVGMDTDTSTDKIAIIIDGKLFTWDDISDDDRMRIRMASVFKPSFYARDFWEWMGYENEAYYALEVLETLT